MVIGRNADRTVLRVPPGMLEQLDEAARVNGRSRNSEMVARLAESLKRDRKRIQRNKEGA